MAKITGHSDEAMTCYEQAIQSARENGIIQHEALANELYAKFWLQRNNTKLAGIYMAEAHARYRQWGATAKAKELEERYLHVRRVETAIFPLEPSTTGSGAELLDLHAVSKASQVISGEIVLSRLVEKLINIVIENAGAQKGLLLLDQDGELVVVAGSEVAENEKASKKKKRHEDTEVAMQPSVQTASGANLSLAMVNFVRRTGDSLVLPDATDDGRYANDPYVMQNRPKSVLCMPILLQSKLVGILYLENNLTPGAFTPDRIEVMQILCAQAAISLENARLYDEVKQEFAERKRAEETLRAVTAGTAAVTGTEFFHSLVKHLAETFHVRYAFVAECTDATKTAVRTVSFLENHHICENFTFALEGTPCEKVIGGQAYYHPEKLYATFPKAVERESYFGMPIHDSQGQIIGHLAIVHDRPMAPEPPPELAIMKIFAARAGAELERKRAEDALKQALAELESLKNRIQEENVYLQEEIKKEYNFDEIIGNSAAIKTVFQNIEKVARTDSTVLITGETGTGKELVANAIHTRSLRHGSALIKVNCAALPAGLIESELFGHEKGAFTGATARKKGRFELADGGTLLLDEVGELPLETQVKLLRVLQEQEFERVGGAQTIKVNVRVIAATNRHLEDAVKHGSFRADLFYRLNIFPIPLPALRERPEDIPMLAHHFVGKFARRTGKRVERMAPEALEMLRQYHWPGNVREMANILERAMILCDGGALQKEHIAISPQPAPKPEVAVLTLEENERALILKALAEANWVVGGANGAAQRLGLNRTTLLARMKKLGIERHKA
ncbi:MAG: Anaerobic nitric oxide reductase transcription regulator NorR [bacterium]|nr:Anaerobic nitric oxide reductase transcription regulator NorR [bacterium]